MFGIVQNLLPRALSGVALLFLAGVASGEGVFEVTLVDPAVTGYATFQSHNQKVVANQHGYFLSYIQTRDEPFLAQNWRLMRSVDEGKSFGLVYEAVHATNAPPIETDADGNIYLACTDFKDGNAYLYRFDAAKDFHDPTVSTIPGGAAGKVALLLDPSVPCLYFASHNNEFYTLGLDGAVLERTTLLQAGPRAGLQYPSLRLDAAGTLHYAWTTVLKDAYLYRDIHHMMRPLGSTSWQNFDGTPLAVPVVADDAGPATRITGDDEFEVHTWLASFLIKGGKAHFLYMNQGPPAKEVYVRRDARSGVEELRTTLDTVLSLSGLFVTADDSPASPLYCVSSKDQYLVALISRDNGSTWAPFARTAQTFHEYSLGGCNTMAPGGWIIGSFTDQKGTNGPGELESKVYFYRLKTE
jgi:hypothetical protein